jgi:hypothetical protein
MRTINIAMAVLTMVGAALVYSAVARAQTSCLTTGSVTTCYGPSGNSTSCVRTGNVTTCY